MAQQNFITNLYLHPLFAGLQRGVRAVTASAPLDSFLFYTIFSIINARRPALLRESILSKSASILSIGADGGRMREDQTLH